MEGLKLMPITNAHPAMPNGNSSARCLESSCTSESPGPASSWTWRIVNTVQVPLIWQHFAPACMFTDHDERLPLTTNVYHCDSTPLVRREGKYQSCTLGLTQRSTPNDSFEKQDGMHPSRYCSHLWPAPRGEVYVRCALLIDHDPSSFLHTNPALRW